MRIRVRQAAALLALCGAVTAGCGEPPSEPRQRLILWATEVAEGDTFVAPEGAEVAYLARALSLSANGVDESPGLNIEAGSATIPVVRIEVDGQHPPTLSDHQRLLVAERVLVAVAEAGAPERLQLDITASTAQRDFYRALLIEVRRGLPGGTQLSIAVPPSWCAKDGWLSSAPVDEVVPKLFRMGGESAYVLQRLGAHADFRSPRCRDALGIATDERLPWLPHASRVYVFRPPAARSAQAVVPLEPSSS